MHSFHMPYYLDARQVINYEYCTDKNDSHVRQAMNLPFLCSESSTGDAAAIEVSASSAARAQRLRTGGHSRLA
jgi:hypothetical protein